MPAISRALGDTVHVTGLGELPPLNSHSGRPPAPRTPGQSPDGPTGPMQQYQQPRGNANPAGRAPGASARCLGRRCRWYAHREGRPPAPHSWACSQAPGRGAPQGFPVAAGGGWVGALLERRASLDAERAPGSHPRVGLGDHGPRHLSPCHAGGALG